MDDLGVIRPAKKDDREAIWTIFQEVIQGGDTYVFPEDTPKNELEKLWFAPYMHTYVYEEAGQILGSYIVKPNQPGRGSHIANASYMVTAATQGRGIGRKLCTHSLQLAKDHGFHGMQFNIVVSTNAPAIALWKKLGFEVIGTTPKGFDHRELGLVDTYIMYREL